jgi:hypothetical protein
MNDVVKQSQIVEMKNKMNIYKDNIINEYDKGIDIIKASKIILEKKNLYNNDKQLAKIIDDDDNDNDNNESDLDKFIEELNESLDDANGNANGNGN